MCIACRKVCFSDNAARKLCFTRCVGVGVGLVLASQEEGRMAEGGEAPISQPVPTQPAGSNCDVVVLPQRPPDLALLMADVNDALRYAGFFHPSLLRRPRFYGLIPLPSPLGRPSHGLPF